MVEILKYKVKVVYIFIIFFSLLFVLNFKILYLFHFFFPKQYLIWAPKLQAPKIDISTSKSLWNSPCLVRSERWALFHFLNLLFRWEVLYFQPRLYVRPSVTCIWNELKDCINLLHPIRHLWKLQIDHAI